MFVDLSEGLCGDSRLMLYTINIWSRFLHSGKSEVGCNYLGWRSYVFSREIIMKYIKIFTLKNGWVETCFWNCQSGSKNWKEIVWIASQFITKIGIKWFWEFRSKRYACSFGRQTFWNIMKQQFKNCITFRISIAIIEIEFNPPPESFLYPSMHQFTTNFFAMFKSSNFVHL